MKPTIQRLQYEPPTLSGKHLHHAYSNQLNQLETFDANLRAMSTLEKQALHDELSADLARSAHQLRTALAARKARHQE